MLGVLRIDSTDNFEFVGVWGFKGRLPRRFHLNIKGWKLPASLQAALMSVWVQEVAKIKEDWPGFSVWGALQGWRHAH